MALKQKKDNDKEGGGDSMLTSVGYGFLGALIHSYIKESNWMGPGHYPTYGHPGLAALAPSGPGPQGFMGAAGGYYPPPVYR